ncbi:MAG: carbohydrate ABC transporter permease [Eubacteriales bacterium]|jgi:putative aldouronate transport system permease protein|nr:carbohydrate ABC transporter permease [Eubacteriales bacterium]MDD3198233.1 carbohydrate ABC transporter permease [Eubacteriales bacterium]MDD3504476.1 carbohydrate ABC transporter permease [Eubacteriales bacterium]MDD4683264.1 carbohydrate ABC transporter permease [Eubacteriales bacterium]
MRTLEDKRWAFVGHVCMIILSILALAPFVLLIIASFTDEAAAIRNGYSYVPEGWSLDAYGYILRQWGVIGRSYLVSMTVTVVGTVAGITMASMIGYTLSKRDLPGRRIILFFITFTMLFNGGLTATYIIYTQVFNIKNTIFGLLIPNLLMNGYSIMMLRNYFEFVIPPALVEAAQIDGAKEITLFGKIIIPLSMPMIATVGLTSALIYWNDWMNGVYYLSANSKLQSIQTLLQNMNENVKFLQQNDLGTQVDASSIPSVTIRMAIAVVGILPVLLLYPIFQRWFVKGIAVGAVKG